MYIKKAASVFILLALLGGSPTAHAISLGEYGITLTSNGFVDSASGLAWLSADLTFGTSDVVDNYIDQGWRIATRNELANLLDRNAEVWYDIGSSSELYYDEFLIMLGVLGIPPNTEFQSAWMCRGYTSTVEHCGSTDGMYFEQPTIFVEPDFDNGDLFGPATSLLTYSYITEAYLYGTFSSDCEICTGSTMLVRAVPLPAGIWGFIAALAVLRSLRKSR